MFHIFRPHILLLPLGLAVLLASCGYEPDSGIPATVRLYPDDRSEYRQFDVPLSHPQARELRLPATVSLPGTGAIFWLSVEAPDLPRAKDVWLALLQPSTASEFWINGLNLDSDGQFPPRHFINSGKNVLYRIPSTLLAGSTNLDIRLRMYSDGGDTRIPMIFFLTDPSDNRILSLINFLSIDLYNYLAFLSCFMFVFFLVQYIQRPKDLPNLFFAIFNLFISGYYLGLGNTYLGLSFTYTVGLTRGLLFLALAAMVMFCLSFTKHPSKLLMFGAGVLGLVLFGNLTFLSHHLSRARSLFNIALIPSMSVLIAALVYLFRLHRQGMKELFPLLVGGGIALCAGVFDSAFALAGIKPLIWLQGIGIFIFLLSVFMTIIERTNLLHRELEGYTRGIEAEVGRRTRELHDTNIALSKANTAKSEFLAHMSHEIRTPLNCIMGFAQMLEQHTVDTEARHNIRLILEEAERLMQLINHILDFSGVEQGNLVLEKRPFKLLESVKRVMEGFTNAAKAKGLQIELMTSDKLPEIVKGDVLRFQQSLINILDNAIKFTEQGFVRLEVLGEGTSPGKSCRIMIRVSDSGIGIPAGRLNSVFNSFEQVDTSITRRYGGSGLGLSIARELIRMMGGEIEIQSMVGHGTIITYTVLLEVVMAVAKEKPKIIQHNTRKHDFGQAHTILVVEDYHTNLEVIRLFLENAGLKILEATSGKEALDILADQWTTINMVLMDLHMPDMDGFETTRKIRQIERFSHIPIVALTADAFDQTRNRCLVAGMQDVLTKPIRYPDLLACIERLIVKAETSHPGGVVSSPKKGEGISGNAVVGQSDSIDLVTLQEVFFDDLSIIDHLVEGFIISGDTLLLELREAMAAMDFPNIHLKAHALRGGALNICAGALSQEAEQLERMAKNSEISGLKEQYEKVLQEWQAMVDWWRNQRKNQTTA